MRFVVWKKKAAVLLAALCLTALTACWDHVEISEMVIIAGIGLDQEPDDGSYHAVVEFINVEADGGESIKAEMVEGRGSTLHSAIQNAMLMTGGTIFGNHCKVVVVGRHLADEGIDDVVELILRSPDFRKTVDILVARDDPAAEIMMQKTVKNEIVSYELSKTLTGNESTIKNTVVTGMYQIHDSLLSDCPYFVVPIVYIAQNKDEPVLKVDGCAVFSGDRLRGFLDGDQSKLFHLITRGNTMPIQIGDTGLPGGPIDVSLTQSDISLIPGLSGDKLSMRLSISAKASLENAILAGLDLSDPAVMAQVRDGISRQLSAEIGELITDVQSAYETDIFDFYREYQDQYRQDWPELRQDWPAWFREMEIDVATDLQIIGSGLIGSYDGQTSEANALP